MRRCSEILFLERGSRFIEKLLLSLSHFVINAINSLATRFQFAQTLFDICVKIFFSLLCIGEIIADISITGTTRFDLAAFRLVRFVGGDRA